MAVLGGHFYTFGERNPVTNVCEALSELLTDMGGFNPLSGATLEQVGLRWLRQQAE